MVAAAQQPIRGLRLQVQSVLFTPGRITSCFLALILKEFQSLPEQTAAFIFLKMNRVTKINKYVSDNQFIVTV